MNEQLYTYSMGSFGVIRFIATEEDGDKITAEVNRRREAEGKSVLTPTHKTPVEIARFETFFE